MGPVSVSVVSSELQPYRWAPGKFFLHEAIEVQNTNFFSIKSVGKTPSPSTSKFFDFYLFAFFGISPPSCPED